MRCKSFLITIAFLFLVCLIREIARDYPQITLIALSSFLILIIPIGIILDKIIKNRKIEKTNKKLIIKGLEITYLKDQKR